MNERLHPVPNPIKLLFGPQPLNFRRKIEACDPEKKLPPKPCEKYCIINYWYGNYVYSRYSTTISDDCFAQRLSEDQRACRIGREFTNGGLVKGGLAIWFVFNT